MSLFEGSKRDESWDLSNIRPVLGETGHIVLCEGGNDTVLGSPYPDVVSCGEGDDSVFGAGGKDILLGDHGSDRLYGGEGDDLLEGGAGNDSLYGGPGEDKMRGNFGNDYYHHDAGGGIDIINEDMYGAEAHGHGGGSDTLYFDCLRDELCFFSNGTDLVVGTLQDAADGSLTDCVVIQEFFTNPYCRLETLLVKDYKWAFAEFFGMV